MNALSDLSPTVQKVMFAVAALVLAVLAFFATRGPGDSPDTATPTGMTTATANNSDVVIVPGQEPATGSTGTRPEEGSPEPELELPISRQAMADTKALTQRFMTEYTTYKYNQDDTKVLNRLGEMLDRDPALSVDDVIPTGTFKAALVKDRYTATSKVTVPKASMISSNMVAYVADAEVTTRRAGTSTTKVTSYLVTLTRESGWGIHNVELADRDASSGGID